MIDEPIQPAVPPFGCDSGSALPSQSELIAGVLDAVQTAPVSAQFVLERLLDQFAG